TLNADGFITKLSADGNSLSFSTAFGGAFTDTIYGIALDASNNIYFTGYTNSDEGGVGAFPVTLGVYDSTFNGGDGDAYVAKMNAAGSSLIFATYLGGEGSEAGDDIEVDSANTIYVIGQTNHSTFPTTLSRYLAAADG